MKPFHSTCIKTTLDKFDAFNVCLFIIIWGEVCLLLSNCRSGIPMCSKFAFWSLVLSHQDGHRRDVSTFYVILITWLQTINWGLAAADPNTFSLCITHTLADVHDTWPHLASNLLTCVNKLRLLFKTLPDGVHLPTMPPGKLHPWKYSIIWDVTCVD